MSTACEIFGRSFRAALEKTPSPELALPSFSGGAAAFAAAALARGDRCVLAITPGLPEADALTADLETVADEAGVRVLEFPPVLEDDAASTAARLKVSAALGAYSIRPYPLVVVAPVPALSAGVAVAEDVQSVTLTLRTGDAALTFAGVQERLQKAGYERVPEVTARGEYSVRGGVLDAWSPDADRPVRAEFFGDELESMRVFDPGLQTSIGKITEAELPPVEMKRGKGSRREKHLCSLFPAGSVLLLLEHNEYSLSQISPAVPDVSRPSSFSFRLYVGDPAPRGVPTGDFQTSPLPGFAEWAGKNALRTSGEPAVDVVRGRLERHLAGAKKRGSAVCSCDGLSAGFELPGLIVVSKSDRVPGAASRRAARRVAVAPAGERLSDTLDIEPGEYVVHLDYGIGRFLGSTEIVVGDTRSEVFTVEYADGAKLHVPVTHAHLLSRYVGVKGEKVKLHRIDGRRWNKEKTEAKKAVQDLAASLLETQAKRAVVPGCAYDVELPEIAAFEAAFPYEPTLDQADAIDDVKRDLASRKPMDRLVCGDAGYGKTEVAMRAAFIVAMNGRQTALLAPTTVLAQQHYETFLARFDGTPVRVEVLSRFQSEEAKKAARQRLASGASDIVIGTHALLSRRVQFKDLGLIVVDEEQRFGVKHKEYLKHLRATADVLTMSATPIPRTLYLSMTGARDLSVLKTPPRERVATETKIVRDTDAVVKSAIEKELARGGQVYYLYNRVLTISKAAERLRALVPDAKVDVAHGQMPTAELAAKMRAFAEGRTEVLLCTTIVESGLDITRANTILVDRADRFGIAELYQLRGRVGRGARQGYAYFLLPAEGLLDSEARERLDALRKHQGHGSGYNLSLRDLEIRGAGNLLGSEQSGHIAAVGFSLYCQLLQRTIARMKGEAVPDIVDVSINLDFLDLSPGSGTPEDTAALPYDYVEEESQRMDFHRRIAEAADLKSVSRLKRELADRYGRLPPAAARLVKLAEFRVRCAAKNVSRLDVKGGRAVFYARGVRDPAFVSRVTESASADRKISELFRLLEDL